MKTNRFTSSVPAGLAKVLYAAIADKTPVAILLGRVAPTSINLGAACVLHWEGVDFIACVISDSFCFPRFPRDPATSGKILKIRPRTIIRVKHAQSGKVLYEHRQLELPKCIVQSTDKGFCVKLQYRFARPQHLDSPIFLNSQDALKFCDFYFG